MEYKFNEVFLDNAFVAKYLHTTPEVIEAIRNGVTAFSMERKPIYKDLFPFCGECKYALATTYKYCLNCGRKVKWE